MEKGDLGHKSPVLLEVKSTRADVMRIPLQWMHKAEDQARRTGKSYAAVAVVFSARHSAAESFPYLRWMLLRNTEAAISALQIGADVNTVDLGKRLSFALHQSSGLACAVRLRRGAESLLLVPEAHCPEHLLMTLSAQAAAMAGAPRRRGR